MASLRSGASVGDVLDRQKGMSAGFDVLRWALALLIFYGHCKWLAGSDVIHLPADLTTTLVERGWSGFRRPFQVALVPMFFALSGFLVTASALRVRDVRNFLTLRALRIFPALTVEVALSALLLGPALTVLALGDYVSSGAFFRYFGNILGFVSFELPGVFAANRTTSVVNANLWTLPAEFYCYLVTAALMWIGQLFDRRTFTWIFAAVTLAAIIASATYGFGLSPTTASTPLLVYYFFAGCLFYHWRHEIPRSGGLFIVASAAAYGLLYWQATAFLAPLFLVYVTVYLGLIHHVWLARLRNFDYSYGIYLYGFPITQALLALFPWFNGHGKTLAVAAGITTLIFAALSWHCIEAPMLALKKRFSTSRKTPVAGQSNTARSAVGSL